MSTKIKVAVAGASGVTGTSVVNALLATPEKFEVTALARPASVGKREYVELAERGVIITPVELCESDELVQALTGQDVVIECMTLNQLEQEKALVNASSKAGVGRYVPSFFGPCCPPRGVMLAREMKEEVLNHIKKLYLPYTAIDVGWWYQLSFPPLPSGRFKAKFEYSMVEVVGDGNQPWAVTDNRDIGKYVAKIIADPRTLNKMVFCHNQIWSQNEALKLLEKMSGESIPRVYVTKEELESSISECEAEMAKSNQTDMLKLGMSQYKHLLGIRGDNTPEKAKYLGYLDARELYPEIEAIPLESYIQDMLDGKLKAPYS
ncbi:isoflavone reductase [Ceratocystis lukuohia]|uniref:Isoflavone reductase n=1 Tax=Ceratocystis lukuohia TaxID=2019550 RepID=A0ABR4MKS5_9PEZI